MTREEAIKGLKENLCAICAYGSQNMDACDIRGCDNRDFIKTLEQEPCIQGKQANADKIDAVYIDGFKAGYSQARFDLEQEPCEDCISRQAAQAKIKSICDEYRLSYEDGERKAATGGSAYALGHAFDDLPSVTPQPKTGHWIMHIDDLFPVESTMECSECGEHQPITISDNYCPNCGAKMIEPQESEQNDETPWYLKLFNQDILDEYQKRMRDVTSEDNSISKEVPYNDKRSSIHSEVYKEDKE